MVDEVSEKIIGIELAAIFAAKNQPMASGEFRWQGIMKCFVDDGPASHGKRVLDLVQDKHDVNWLVWIDGGHRLLLRV